MTSHCFSLSAVTGFALLFLSVASGQTPQSFDVIAIRTNPSGAAPGTGFDLNGVGRMKITNITLKALIRTAYRLQSDQILGGPGWLDSDRYDIDAKTDNPEKIEPDQLQTMLRNLLADRFGVKVHTETRELTVYALVSDKGGAKMKENTDGPATFINTDSGPGSTRMTGKVSVDQLAGHIGSQLGRVVVDKTGLKGFYNVALEWDPMQAGDTTGPSLFTALTEQLGLRLDTQRAQVEVLLIDTAQHPSGN